MSDSVTERRAFVVMGVSGTGKSTIGQLFAEQMGYQFFDGDDYHGEKNIQKMKSGVPLTDEDRAGWLTSLRELIENKFAEGVVPVVACSALKKRYRDQFRNSSDIKVHFIYLAGEMKLIEERMEQRARETKHFMKAGMLQSQFDTLENPTGEECVFPLSIIDTPEMMVEKACQYFKN